MLKKIIVFIFLFCIVKSAFALPSITASVNTDTVTIGEELFYTLSPMETPSIPDNLVNALEKNFEITGNAYSSNFVFGVNGMVNNSILSITIVPKKTGKLTIPSVNINGKQTNPIEITVTDQSSSSQRHATSRRIRRSQMSSINQEIQDAFDRMDQLMNGGYRQQRTAWSGHSGNNNSNQGYNTNNISNKTNQISASPTNNNSQAGYHTGNNNRSSATSNSTVTPPTGSPDIFIKSFIDKSNPYKGEQVIYTTRAYFFNPPTNDALIDPPYSVPSQFDTEKANNVRWGQENVNGVIYRTCETDSVIFPVKSGEIVIPAPTLSVQSRFSSSISRTLALFPRKHQQYMGDTVKITAKAPLPPSLPGDHWLPAKDIVITESLSPRQDKYRIGDNITRTITVEAKGQLSRNLPSINKTDDRRHRYNIYQGKDDRKDSFDNINTYGVLGAYTTEFVITPLESGEIKLPDYEIPYFNTDRKQFITAKSQPSKIFVIEADTRNDKMASDINKTTEENENNEKDDNKEDVATLKDAFERLKTLYGQAKKLIVEHPYDVAVAIAAMFVLMILRIMFKKRKENKAAETENASPTDVNYKKELKDAISAKDPSRAKLAAVRLYNHEFGTHYSTIESVAGNLKYVQFSAEVDILNNALYSKDGKTWDRKEFYETLITGIKNKKEEITQKPTVPNLYPF